MGLPVLDGIQEMVCIYVGSLLNDFLKGANQGKVLLHVVDVTWSLQ